MQPSRPANLLACAFLFIASAAAAAPQTVSVTVSAGDFDRRGTVVRFVLPGSLGTNIDLSLREGGPRAIQTGRGRTAAFVVDDLKAGDSRTYRFGINENLGGLREVPPRIVTRRTEDRVQFVSEAKMLGAVVTVQEANANSRPLLDYQAEPGALPRDNIKPAFKRGGYLHPIRTPSGRVVTDDFPPNHIHHHGVWWAWTKTSFDGREPDFWNMGDGKGRVEFASLDQTWSGPVHGGFRSQHRFVDLTASSPMVVLNEAWEVTVYAPTSPTATYWIFDLISEQHCATPHALKLPEYRYGGIGLRGNWLWNGKDKTSFLTSEGETDRDKGNATRGRWCDMGGQVEGQPVGIAILGHPSNYRAPQPMRLHPTEPFFNFAPQQAGDMEIKPGDSYVARYRFVVHDGVADRAELDRLWNDYAHPPSVRVEVK